MKTKTLLSGISFLFLISTFGQKVTIDLTFTAVDSAEYIQLDSIKVMNLTQGDSAKLYWPDTVLTYEITPGDLLLYIGYSTRYPVGLDKINKEMKQFQLFQNYPNPLKDQSIISMSVPEKGTVSIMITDIQGKLVISSAWQLDKGSHSFRFTPGYGNLFFLTARWNGISRSIKILTIEPNTGKICTLNYTGSENGEPTLKSSPFITDPVMQESAMVDSPDSNETNTFQFAYNIPCPGTPTVTYEGQVYNTIQIFSQCWLKENLNVGTMIQGTEEMTDNSIIEKYCYNNEPDSCTKYGGLYQWNEMMQYTTQEGIQGICPPDWHILRDEEWKLLEGAVDSHYGIGNIIWDGFGNRGFDAGTNLRTTDFWYNSGNGTDLFGFSGMPGGVRDGYSDFQDIGENGYWWTSTEIMTDLVFDRGLYYLWPESYRGYYFIELGFSVRCVRDY